MPEALESKLRATAVARWPHDQRRQDRYVYGTLRHTGWKPRRQRRRRQMMAGG